MEHARHGSGAYTQVLAAQVRSGHIGAPTPAHALVIACAGPPLRLMPWGTPRLAVAAGFSGQLDIFVNGRQRSECWLRWQLCGRVGSAPWRNRAQLLSAGTGSPVSSGSSVCQHRGQSVRAAGGSTRGCVSRRTATQQLRAHEAKPLPRCATVVRPSAGAWRLAGAGLPIAGCTWPR